MRRWNTSLLVIASAALAAVGTAPRAGLAQGLVWATAHASRAGADTVAAFDASGARVRAFAPAGGRADGIAVVGNVVYYTAGSSIYKMDATTGAGLGVIATSLSFGMPTLAWDGANFWTTTANPAGSSQAFRIGTDGVVNRTIVLSRVSPGAFGYADGLEYFGGELIANRGGASPTYDVYDLDGNALRPGFLSAPGPIAFDGTNFLSVRGYRLDMSGVEFDVRSGTTGAVLGTRVLPAPGGSYPDISFNYAGRADLVTTTPEPRGVVLIATGLGLLAVCMGRRRADPRTTA